MSARQMEVRTIREGRRVLEARLLQGAQRRQELAHAALAHAHGVQRLQAVDVGPVERRRRARATWWAMAMRSTSQRAAIWPSGVWSCHDALLPAQVDVAPSVARGSTQRPVYWNRSMAMSSTASVWTVPMCSPATMSLPSTWLSHLCWKSALVRLADPLVGHNFANPAPAAASAAGSCGRRCRRWRSPARTLRRATPCQPAWPPWPHHQRGRHLACRFAYRRGDRAAHYVSHLLQREQVGARAGCAPVDRRGLCGRGIRRRGGRGVRRGGEEGEGVGEGAPPPPPPPPCRSPSRCRRRPPPRRHSL